MAVCGCHAAPFTVTVIGLTFMGSEVAVDRDIVEAVLTIIGVALVRTGTC